MSNPFSAEEGKVADFFSGHFTRIIQAIIGIVVILGLGAFIFCWVKQIWICKGRRDKAGKEAKGYGKGEAYALDGGRLPQNPLPQDVKGQKVEGVYRAPAYPPRTFTQGEPRYSPPPPPYGQGQAPNYPPRPGPMREDDEEMDGVDMDDDERKYGKQGPDPGMQDGRMNNSRARY